MEEITKEGVLADLKKYASYSGTPEKEAEYLEKTKLPKELASLLFTAYTQGIDIYFKKWLDANIKADEYERKYTKLATKLADKMIEE